MDHIERYAVDLLVAGSQSVAEDDLDEDGEFEDEAEWRSAVDLTMKCIRRIKENPEAFLGWCQVMEEQTAHENGG